MKVCHWYWSYQVFSGHEKITAKWILSKEKSPILWFSEELPELQQGILRILTMCVFISACSLWIHVFVYLFVCVHCISASAYFHVCMCVSHFLFVCVSACLCVYVYICLSFGMCVSVPMYACFCLYVWVCISVSLFRSLPFAPSLQRRA